MFAGFAAAIFATIGRGATPDCHCFGRLHSEPVGLGTLRRVLLLALVAALCVSVGHETADLSATAWIDGLGTTGRVAVGLGAVVAILVLLVIAMTRLVLALARRQGELLARVDALERQQPPMSRLSVIGVDREPQSLNVPRTDGLPTLLVFSDPGCGPCNALKPRLAQWQRELGDRLAIAEITRGSASDSPHEDLFSRYGIVGTPSAVLVRADGSPSPVGEGAPEIEQLIAGALEAGSEPGLGSAVADSGGLELTPSDLVELTGGTVLVEPADAMFHAVDTTPFDRVLLCFACNPGDCQGRAHPRDLVLVLCEDDRPNLLVAREAVADAFGRGALAALAHGPVRPTAAQRAGRAALPAPPAAFATVTVEDPRAALVGAAKRWREQHSGTQIVGVTGSVGKTTTCEAIASVLRPAMSTLTNGSPLNGEPGVAATLLTLRAEHRVAVLELGMHSPGDMARLTQLAAPSVSVVTAIAPAHLERLGTLDAVASEKAEIIRGLAPEGVAVVNGDDPRVRAMAADGVGHAVFYGLGANNDWRATDVVDAGLDGMTFTLEHRGRSERIESLVVGRHNLYALLAASAVGDHFGLSFVEICATLRSLHLRARQRVHHGPGELLVIDDAWNANPASMAAALEVLAGVPRRRVAVLGDMLELGSHHESAHRDVGRRAAQMADFLVTIGPGGRLIAKGAGDAGMPSRRIISVADPQDLQPTLERLVRDGDVVLVKGSHALELGRVVPRLLDPHRTRRRRSFRARRRAPVSP